MPYPEPLSLPANYIRVVLVVTLQTQDVLSVQRMVVAVQYFLQDFIDASEADLVVFTEVVRREKVKVVSEVL